MLNSSGQIVSRIFAGVKKVPTTSSKRTRCSETLPIAVKGGRASSRATQPTPAGAAAVGEVGAPPAVVEPEELCLALAAFCEQEQLGDSEVRLHLYPFGGVESGLRMLQRM